MAEEQGLSAEEQDEAQKQGLPALPFPACTFADHSYRAYTKAQMIAYGLAARSEGPQPPVVEVGEGCGRWNTSETIRSARK